jgi:hypothetical protein
MPDLLAAHTEIRRYIDRIRSAKKRAYAERYYQQVIRNGLPDPYRVGDPAFGGLSYMGAQSVRLEIAQIIKAA